MTRKFVKGQTPWREIKGVTKGASASPDDDALYAYLGDGVFEPVREPLVVGAVYRYSEVEGRIWCPNMLADAKLRYCEDEQSGQYFEEVVEASPHSLVPAESAQATVEQLLREGLSLRDVAKAAGISEPAAARAAAGHGFVRRATAAALEAAAAANGKPV
jgi:hypothetical protein